MPDLPASTPTPRAGNGPVGDSQGTGLQALQSQNAQLQLANQRLEARLEESSRATQQLRSTIVSAGIAALVVDRRLHITHYTPQACEIFGPMLAESNRSLPDLSHTFGSNQLAADAGTVLKTGQTVERSVTSRDSRCYLVQVRPYRSSGTTVDGAALTFVDITALNRAEQKVRQGAEQLQLAAEASRDYAILTIDEDGLVAGWNLGAKRMFGYDLPDIIGKPYALLFTPEDRAAGVAQAELHKAASEGRASDERWHLRQDGSRFFANGVVTPLAAPSGGYAKIARDLTETMALQENRDEMLRQEQQLNWAKDQFLAVMSHELKHPLNLIQVSAELLVSQPEVRALPMAARAGATIRLAVASQTKIIDDLLDLSRARTGKLNLRLESVDLQAIAAAIAAAASDSAGRKGLTLDYVCTEAELFVLGDRVRTEQVLWNLINNAIKFTPPGGSVLVQLSQETDFARFCVSDNGQGIAPEFLPQVFGMFVQAPHLLPSTNPGLGVGLTLVRDLVVAQGGKVLADSPGLGRGASFTVWLPLAQTRPKATQSEVLPGNLKGLRILAVDDMADLLEPFAALLRLEGAEVDTALGGQAALDQLKVARYDLLISDIGMPIVDGYDLIRNIRKNPALDLLKAIALSGYGRQVDAVRALQSGFDAHLAKPATMAHICQTIAQLFATSGR